MKQDHMHPVLEVEGVCFRRGRPILRSVNWRVDPGQHWCVLGPNGCGKTSLINIITGYESATDGRITLDGETFGESDWREVRKRVGLVASTLTTWLEPGEAVIDAVVSGREAMLNLIDRVPPRLVREAGALLRSVGCDHLRHALWGPLSQGEKQKVLICRALMARYRVLILDEPCAGLDPVARDQFLRWLQVLGARKNAPSLVMVTHHVEEILPCITHVLLLKGGKVHAAGPKRKTLTGRALSEVYGASLKLRQKAGRYQLVFAPDEKGVARG
ncbi:MAG: ATP-binding cassette domain-containing protein [Verrucomicrobiaceae bacterium]|nr:ATP-binding cassette domain-containing protein [Verrucomicrobiaceae bacterium]